MQISPVSRIEAPLVPWRSSLIVLATLVCIGVVQTFMLPHITSIDVPGKFLQEGEVQDGVVRIIGSSATTASFDLHLQSGILPPPEWYSVLIVGAVDQLTVNGQDVEKKHDYAYSRIGPLLNRSASNIVHVTMHLVDPLPLFVFGLEPSIWGLITGGLFLLGCGVLLAWMIWLKKDFADAPTWIVVCGGVFLRYFYMSATPYYARAYDFHGHIDVIRYIAEHLSLPPTRLLWEAYQMPLYYVLLAPLYRLVSWFGLSFHEAAAVLRLPSFLFSVLTLFVGVRLAQRVFQKDVVSLRIVAMLLATFPWLLYLSSQITNDVLTTFVGFLWIAVLYRALAEPSRRTWAMVGMACGIGILSKMSAAPWVAVSMLCAFLPPSHAPFRRRMWNIVTVPVVAFVVGGWFYALRKLVDPGFGLIANAFHQWGAPPLLLTLRGLFGFNLVRLIHLPFRQFDAGGFPDDHIFIEDLIRTAHFGSVSLSPEAAILFVLLIAPMIALFVGLFQEVKKRHLEDAIIIFGLLSAMLIMRLQYPFPPSQHFRYAAVIALPCILLIARGMSIPRSTILRAFFHVSAGVYALVCGAIVFAIAATG